MANAIAIEGMSQYLANLRKLRNDMPKVKRLANDAAADIVLTDARPKVPNRSGRARKSLRKLTTGTDVDVVGGGTTAPYFPWLDRGGRVGRNRSVSRTFLPDGRYAYRSYLDLNRTGRFEEAMSQALIEVANSAGIEVR